MLARVLLRHFLLPAAERLTPTRFWSYYTKSVRFDFMGEQKRQLVQNTRLSRVWNAALGSPLHRERLESTGLPSCPVDADGVPLLLGKLTPIAKTEFRRLFPAGTLTDSHRKDWRYVSTSGTIDDRMTVVADFMKRDHNRSSELRALHIAMNADVAVKTVEIPPNACNVVCGLGDSGPPRLWSYLWDVIRHKRVLTGDVISDLRGRLERQLVLCRSTLPPIEPAPPAQLAEILGAQLDRIEALGPRMLRGFPVYLLWLADALRAKRGALPGLHLVGPYGGLASAHMISRISTGFGTRFANIYGTNELGTMAAACGHSSGMHVFEDLFLFEVFQRGQLAQNGQIGRLVITDLTNTAMPLIRYDVGDVGRLHVGPCPCGRNTARVEILGRVEEMLASPAGPLPACSVADTFFADPGLANFRLEETAPGSFEAALVASHVSVKPDVESWKERFVALHPGVHRLRGRIVPFVRPERSGKYRFIHPLRRDVLVL